MERMTSRLLRHYNQKEHFYSTQEYQEHKDMFDFYKKNRDELINFVGYRPDSFLTLEYLKWYLVVTREFERFYKLNNEYLKLLNYTKLTHQPNYNDEYQVKNIAQAEYRFGIKHCVYHWNEKIIKKRNEVFEFLDSVDNPYKHIFIPIWEINNYAYEKGYYPYQTKGVDKITMFVASEYAKYKVSQKINEYGNKA